MATISLTFASTAYNESANIKELIGRCRDAHARIAAEFASEIEIRFRFVIADNASIDNSVDILRQISELDTNINALVNHANYGPEASAVNALRQATSSDLIVLLCSDLQDPPELSVSMVRILLQRPEVDAVLAVKDKSSGSSLVRIAKRTYYKVLGYSTRLARVPNGFHGYGCYRRETIQEALRYWDLTDLNLRQCLANACQYGVEVKYSQANRIHGRSSYDGFGYWSEAIRSLASGDATASRLAIITGTTSLLISFIVGILIVLNVMTGSSGYGRGIPTVLGISILSFAVQMLMFGLLSRQIEAVRMGGMRKKVRFHRINEGQSKS
jgi:glycosyltransferase involved in cell wall biosynthesis